MSVQIYSGSAALVRRSGVGQAMLHQKQMLAAAGVASTDRPSPDARTVHINTVLPGAPLAALQAHLAGKKVVYYGHSTEEDFRSSFKGSDRLAPLFRRWIRFCYERGDVVITPTPYSKRLLEEAGVRRPIYALSNGVDTDFFAPSAQRRRAFREKYGLSETDKAVLSVGHYIARKGILEFVELARRLPEVRFFWFGHTDLRLVPRRVRDAIAGAPSNVTFPGFADQAALRDAYCGCDVFAFMSHEETEGIVVLEALACGIPTVVRDIPVYREWLTAGASVYKAKDGWDFLRKVAGLLDGSLPALTASGLRAARSRSIPAVGRVLRTIYELEGLPYQSPAEERTALPARASRAAVRQA